MRVYGILSLNDLSCLNGFARIAVLGLLLFSTGCNATSGWAMNRSGMRQYQRGHFAQARHRFARAIAHDPCNPDYRHNLAMAVQKQGDLAASERILRYNLAIDAMHQPTYHSLAQLMVTEGRASEAQELISSWAATQPYVPEANIEMAWIQRETGDYASAEQSLQNALRADPTHPIALSHLGQLYQSTGRPDQAAAYYQRSLASNWDQPEVQSRLATLIDPSSMSRSAIMRNDPSGPMLAGGPIMSGDTMMASNTMMTANPMISGVPPLMSGSMIASTTPTMVTMSTGGLFGSEPQAIALEDPRANPAPRTRRRRHERENDAVIASYPLPSYDASASAWKPTMFAAQPSMASQPQFGMEVLGPPQLVDSSNGTGLVPQADPAHFGPPEMTASLPVVDPH